MSPTNETISSKFPMKTLLWILFAVLMVFMFRPELKNLIGNAEELSVLGIEIKTSKKAATLLKEAAASYEQIIDDQSAKYAMQETKIDELNKIKKDLEKDLKKCPSTKTNATLFNAKFSQIMSNSKEIKADSDKLKGIKIIKQASFINQGAVIKDK